MKHQEVSYIIFGIVLTIALIFDLGLLSRKSKIITTQAAWWQTLLWVGLSLCFCFFLWQENGQQKAVSYLSAYLMEWSLSVDNIFVFILIFNAFKVKQQYYARVLLIGILIAIILRVIFIFVGVALVQQYYWVNYIFGVFLIYTGIKMLFSRKEHSYKPEENKVYRFMKKILPLSDEESYGNFFVRKNNKILFTPLSFVIGILAITDILFAMDSIPAVLAISQDKLVVYTSNIFAVLGLRSLFFLLQGAVHKFTHLQLGVAAILVFVGLKMFTYLFNFELPIYVSLIVIVICIVISILYSLYHQKREKTI